MCWSASVSLNTYILSKFACLFAYMNGITPLVTLCFYQSFICMQLIEYFIWSKTFSNKILSQIAYIVIILQPVFALLCLKNKTLKITSMILYILFIIVYFIMPWSSVDFRTTVGPNGHLAWHWLKVSLPVIIIWMVFLLLRLVENKDWISLILAIILVIISYILYHKTYTWGSLWCWASALVSIVLIYNVFKNDFCKP